MKRYQVATDKLTLGSGEPLRAGAILPASAFTAGQLASCLRLGRVAEYDEVPDDQVEQVKTPKAPPKAPPKGEGGGAKGEGDDESVSLSADEILDQPIDQLAVGDRAKAALKAAELLAVGDAVDYYREHRSFEALEGVGKKLSEEISAAVALVETLLAEV